MSKVQGIQVYATHKGRVIKVDVLSVNETHIRVSLEPSPFDGPREFRLPLADLKACHPVKREWNIKVKDPRDRRFSRTIKMPVEFFLSEELARTHIIVGRDLTATLASIKRNLEDADRQLRALLHAGGRLPPDSEIPGQIACLQGIIESTRVEQLSLGRVAESK